MPIRIYVDADGCPVKDEVYKVASRYQIQVHVVANQYLNVPLDPLIQMNVVSGGFDAADDWIAQQAGPNDIIVTSDILLAERCVKKNARVLGPKGNEFTEDNVGMAVANRELAAQMRMMGDRRGGPSAMDKNARSQFLSKLDQIIQALKRKSRN